MRILAEVENRWKTIKAKDKSVKELAGVHQDLIKRMVLHEPQITPFAITESVGKEKLAKGEYLLYGVEKEIELEYALLLLRDLAKWNGLGKSSRAVKKWLQISSDDELRELFYEHLCNADQRLRQVSEVFGVELSLLSVLLQYCLLPTLDMYCKVWRESVSLSDWKRGYCPVCGSLPLLAELRDSEQFRYLRCGSCGCDWLYKRLGCFHCETTDHRMLDYYFIEEEKNRFRIDVCNQCNNYLKGFPVLTPAAYPLLLLEDLATLHLDLLAGEKGYYR